MSVPRHWLLGGWCHQGLIVHQQRHRPSDSNTNVDIKFSAHDAFLLLLFLLQVKWISYPLCLHLILSLLIIVWLIDWWLCNVNYFSCIIRSRSLGALMVEVWICTTMALQNLQQYGCQTRNKLKDKSRDLNRNSSRNKNETMFDSGYENCPEFGVLGGVIFKLDIL